MIKKTKTKHTHTPQNRISKNCVRQLLITKVSHTCNGNIRKRRKRERTRRNTEAIMMANFAKLMSSHRLIQEAQNIMQK